MSSSTADILLAAAFVAGALVYLGFRLKKKIREIRNPSSGCSCGCGCSRSKIELPKHLRKK